MFSFLPLNSFPPPPVNHFTMTRFVLPLAILFLLCTCDRAQTDARTAAHTERPAPTGVVPMNEEDSERNREARAAYEELLHRAAPGTDWRQLETENALVRNNKRRNRSGQKTAETFADGQLTGEWFERGATTVTGSVHDLAQDPDDPNRIFVLSDGGSLWRMDYTARTYELVNHDLQLGTHWLGFVPTDATATDHNLVGYLNGRPAYSTDYGRSWEPATVTNTIGQPIGSSVSSYFSPTVFGTDLYTTAEMAGTRRLFRSTDGGVTYRLITNQHPEVNGTPEEITHLEAAPGTGALLMATKRMYNDPLVSAWRVRPGAGDSLLLEHLTTFDVDASNFFRGRIGAAVQPESDSLRVYLTAHQQLFRSDNDGVAWREMPNLEVTPWARQALYVRPSDPDFVAYGAVELWVSRDGGETHERPNRWYDYYNDTDRYLHADIMNLTELTTPTGERTLIVSSHGGLNELNEADSLWYNIAPDQLHTAQYYDVRTSPTNRRFIAGGSQDQGMQFLESERRNSTEMIAGEQVFSGDYGHLEFSPDGNFLFTNYPGGSIYTFYDLNDFAGNWRLSSVEVESADEFIWITPSMLVPGADGEDFTYYIAGGSAVTDRPGSFLIEVETETDPNDIRYGEMTMTDKPFDFRDGGGGNLTALAYSPLNPDRFYAATQIGRFHTSDDRGETWEETLNFIPEGWYLYGQAIHASRTEPETVWLGGSGYSNPPVWRSTDGGVNFEPVSEGLPPTTVIGLASNPTESLLFAATEAGPFVYVTELERWFDLTGDFAPTQRFTSVEYIDETKTARFGTYGRGVWDFQVQELTSTEAEILAAAPDFRVFPNPASGVVTVTGNAAGYRMYDLSGREVRSVRTEGARTPILRGAARRTARVPIADLKPGLYFVQPTDAEGRGVGLARRLVVE